MNAVENILPTTGLLVVHAGANNVAPTKFPGHIAAAMLLNRCFHLLRLRPHIQEISICSLSRETVDSQVQQAIIIWKRLVGHEIRNGEPPAKPSALPFQAAFSMHRSGISRISRPVSFIESETLRSLHLNEYFF